MPDLTFLPQSEPTAIEQLVGDYLAACPARVDSRQTDHREMAAGTAFVSSLLHCIEDVHIGAPNAIAVTAEDAQGLPRYVDARTVRLSHSRDIAADLVSNPIP
jgi:hypothetical protein